MLHKFNCEFDLALTYALKRPKLALQCAQSAWVAALLADRTDLVSKASALIKVLA